MSNSSIRLIDKILLGATTTGQSGPGSDDNEEVLHIPQSSGITGASPSDYLMPYPGHSLGEGSYSTGLLESIRFYMESRRYENFIHKKNGHQMIYIIKSGLNR